MRERNVLDNRAAHWRVRVLTSPLAMPPEPFWERLFKLLEQQVSVIKTAPLLLVPLALVLLSFGVIVGWFAAGSFYRERIQTFEARIGGQGDRLSERDRRIGQLAPYDVNQPQTVKTVLRLQFFGDVRVPTKLHSENIFRWY